MSSKSVTFGNAYIQYTGDMGKTLIYTTKA